MITQGTNLTLTTRTARDFCFFPRDACAGIKKEESYYFEGYADISIHEQMISDSTRTDTYR